MLGASPIVAPCGCTLDPAHESGVLRSVHKCPRHRLRMREPADLDASYYAELGLLDGDGRPRPTNHVAELLEALGPLPPAPGRDAQALEVGCGVSPYVPAIQRAGYHYRGLDASAWTAGWMRAAHGVTVLACDFDQFQTPDRFALILACHCFEHFADAPGAIRRCAELLLPGGRLWLIVPDDSDLVNPDHLWFFSPRSLRRCLDAAGLVVERLEARRVVPHELFLYASALKG